LIWILTARAVQDQRIEVRETAERVLSGQAGTLAESITQELMLIDQSLTIVQDAWKRDSDSVNLADWTKQMPAVMGVADDFFIADDQHIIRQDILPQAVGQGVGAAYVTFPHGVLEVRTPEGETAQPSTLLQIKAGDPVDAREFLIYIVRLLDHPKGWLVGASYRSAELVRMFGRASLGYNAVAALVDTQHGRLQAVVGPAARRPTTDLSKTIMYQALLRDDPAVWLGPSGIDDVRRLHAFRRIPNRDMGVLVAASYQEVMRPAEDLAAETRFVALLGSLLVAGTAVLVGYGLLSFRLNRRRRQRAERHAAELDRLRQTETTNAARAETQAAYLQGLLDHGSDGVALLDAGLLLVQWNARFAKGIGVPLHRGLALDAILRQQAASGLFEAGADPEPEIARRTTLLRLTEGGLSQPGPDGRPLFLRGVQIPTGGLILVLTGLAALPELPVELTPLRGDTDEPAVQAPIEW
jgi:PAS domain-containing protein